MQCDVIGDAIAEVLGINAANDHRHRLHSLQRPSHAQHNGPSDDASDRMGRVDVGGTVVEVVGEHVVGEQHATAILA